MAQQIFVLAMLVSTFGFLQCKVRGWPPGWSWSHPQLSDEEIVDLLYTDPDRLRELTSGYDSNSGFDVSQDISIPSTGPGAASQDYEDEPPPPTGNSDDYSEPSGPYRQPGQATSFTSVQHYSPNSGTSIPHDLLSYSQLVVH